MEIKEDRTVTNLALKIQIQRIVQINKTLMITTAKLKSKRLYP